MEDIIVKNETPLDIHIDLDRFLCYNSYITKVFIKYKDILYKVDIDRIIAMLMFNNCLEVTDE